MGKLVIYGAQAGLSWRNILTKRANFRAAVEGFDPGHHGPAEGPAETEISRAISHDLSRRGFNLCGPTIIHAVLPAVEMVNDHVVTCPRHAAGRRMG